MVVTFGALGGLESRVIPSGRLALINAQRRGNGFSYIEKLFQAASDQFQDSEQSATVC